MALFHAPSSHNKSWLPKFFTENSAANTVASNNIYANFPRKTGFNSLHDLANTANMLDLHNHYEIETVNILNLVSNTGHLGKEYTEYMLLNISECLYLISVLEAIYTERSKHLLYSTALSQLISINLYRKKYNQPHSLPKTPSRKFINIQLALYKYLDEHGS